MSRYSEAVQVDVRKRMIPPHRQSLDRHRAQVYEQARQRHSRRWTGAPRCWRQPEVVWINQPADDFIAQTAKLELAA